MNPTADDIAIAIVAACRETGEDPVEVAAGNWAHKKARHYAMHALVHVFRATSPHRLAAYVGADHPKQFWANSHATIVRAKNGRKHAALWWDDVAYDRVIRAIEADRTRRAVAPKEIAPPANNSSYLADENGGQEITTNDPVPEAPPRPGEPTVEVSAYVEPPPYRPPPSTLEKALRKDEPSGRPFRHGSGYVDRNGYRPPKGTIEAVLDDDDRPVMDRGGQFSDRRRSEKPVLSKRNLEDELRRAVANTKPRAEE
jgi:hypothetical protein